MNNFLTRLVARNSTGFQGGPGIKSLVKPRFGLPLSANASSPFDDYGSNALQDDSVGYDGIESQPGDDNIQVSDSSPSIPPQHSASAVDDKDVTKRRPLGNDMRAQPDKPGRPVEPLAPLVDSGREFTNNANTHIGDSQTSSRRDATPARQASPPSAGEQVAIEDFSITHTRSQPDPHTPSSSGKKMPAPVIKNDPGTRPDTDVEIRQTAPFNDRGSAYEHHTVPPVAARGDSRMPKTVPRRSGASASSRASSIGQTEVDTPDSAFTARRAASPVMLTEGTQPEPGPLASEHIPARFHPQEHKVVTPTRAAQVFESSLNETSQPVSYQPGAERGPLNYPSMTIPTAHDAAGQPNASPTVEAYADLPPARRGEQRTANPTVKVSIGRIEIRASQPAPSPAPAVTSQPRVRRGPTMSLDDYLAKGRGGRA